MSVTMAIKSKRILLGSKQVAHAINMPVQKTLFFNLAANTVKSIEIRNRKNNEVKKKGDIVVNDFVNNNMER
jgi:hypothetical protein